MEGVIELPGEVNPLTENRLYHVLLSASSSNPHQIQSGTKQLQAWELEKGYYPLLQSVFLDRSLPIEVRHLAVIQLKNGVDKYWRRAAINAVDRHDKTKVRSGLIFSAISEANHALLVQAALVIGKITRFDFPNEWPDAISSLIDVLRSSSSSEANPMHLSRALLILLYMVKELLTARLQRQRANLLAITPELFHVLGQIYISKAQRWQAFLRGHDDDEGGALEGIEQSLLALRVIRRLIVSGFEYPYKDNDVCQFWGILKGQLGDILTMSSDTTLSPSVRELIDRNAVQIAKLHFNMASSHPASFVLLPDSLELVRSYWELITRYGESLATTTPALGAKVGTDGDADEDSPPVQEKLSLYGFLILRVCLKVVFNRAHTFRYTLKEDKDETIRCAELIKERLLTGDLVRQIMEVTVTRYFVFRPSDLRRWEEEPDEWDRKEEEEGEAYEFSIRPCAEKVFLDLVIHFNTTLVEPLLNVFRSVATLESDDVFLKDSVYTAIGLAAPSIHERVDFDSFVNTTLVNEVQKQQPHYNILRRRIAILLGQWISVKISADTLPVVYQIFQFLLDPSDRLNDQVVRVTAGRHLKHVVDEWGFNAEKFMPHASDILGRLMALIQAVELSETKMALLNTISVIVERLEHNITPFSEGIVDLLPSLWDQSGPEHLMKQAILTILTRLVNAMKVDSKPLHHICIPIIQGAVNPESETHLYLLEDALDLWSSIVAQTESPTTGSETPNILSLIPCIVPTLELSVDGLRKGLEITDSYMLLAPGALLSDSLRPSLLSTLTNSLGHLRPEANGAVTHTIEELIRSAEVAGGQAGVRILVGDMVQLHLLAKVLGGLKGAWKAHQLTGPRARERQSPVEGVVETDYFTILARIACIDPMMLLDALVAASSGQEPHIDETMKWLLDEWFSHFENIGNPDRKKLMCLALTKLLETERGWILAKLQDLMIIWTDVVNELTYGNEDKSVDSLVWTDDTGTATLAGISPEERRNREAAYADPIHTINVVELIKGHLQRAVAVCGGHETFQKDWLVNVDNDVVESFSKLGVA